MTPPQETPFADAIRILEANYYDPPDLAVWLTSPHPQLDNRSALEALAAGKAADVLAIVKRLDDAVYL